MTKTTLFIWFLVPMLTVLSSTLTCCEGTKEQCDEEMKKVIPFEGQSVTAIEIPNNKTVVYDLETANGHAYYSCNYFNDDPSPDIKALPKSSVTKISLKAEVQAQ